jgi:uncharacterized membrane protein
MNYQVVVFWALALAWFFAFCFVYRRNYPSRLEAKDVALDAMFIAIILLMGFVPQVGYITLVPGLSLTLLHLPVLIGAYLFGWKKGALYGLVFGVTSWIEAMIQGTGFNVFFLYPWVSILPRLLFGAISGFCFQLLKKNPKIYGTGWVVGGISFLLTCLHTALVFADLYVFYPQEIQGLFTSGSSLINGVTFTFLAMIALGMVGEASLAAILVPSTGRMIVKVKGNKQEEK